MEYGSEQRTERQDSQGKAATGAAMLQRQGRKSRVHVNEHRRQALRTRRDRIREDRVNRSGTAGVGSSSYF